MRSSIQRCLTKSMKVTEMKSDHHNLIIWNRNGSSARLAARCAPCRGLGRIWTQSSDSTDCEHCSGCGWFGIDPHSPVKGHPGSVEKIAMLMVRYASGVPLWNEHDGLDEERETSYAPLTQHTPASMGIESRPAHLAT